MSELKFKRSPGGGGLMVTPEGKTFARIGKLVWGTYEIRYESGIVGGAHWFADAKEAVRVVYAQSCK